MAQKTAVQSGEYDALKAYIENGFTRWSSTIIQRVESTIIDWFNKIETSIGMKFIPGVENRVPAAERVLVEPAPEFKPATAFLAEPKRGEDFSADQLRQLADATMPPRQYQRDDGTPNPPLSDIEVVNAIKSLASMPQGAGKPGIDATTFTAAMLKFHDAYPALSQVSAAFHVADAYGIALSKGIEARRPQEFTSEDTPEPEVVDDTPEVKHQKDGILAERVWGFIAAAMGRSKDDIVAWIEDHDAKETDYHKWVWPGVDQRASLTTPSGLAFIAADKLHIALPIDIMNTPFPLNDDVGNIPAGGLVVADTEPAGETEQEPPAKPQKSHSRKKKSEAT